MHQLVEVKRLGDEVGRAPFDGLDGVPHRAVARDDDADDGGIARARGVDHRGAVDARQPQVGDQEVEGELLNQFERLLAALGLDDFEAALGQAFGRQLPEGGFVIDQEEVGGGVRHAPTF